MLDQLKQTWQWFQFTNTFVYPVRIIEPQNFCDEPDGEYLKKKTLLSQYALSLCCHSSLLTC